MIHIKRLSEYTEMTESVNQGNVINAVDNALFGSGKFPYSDWKAMNTEDMKRDAIIGYIKKCSKRTSMLNLYFLMTSVYEFLERYEDIVPANEYESRGFDSMVSELQSTSSRWEEGIDYVSKDEVLGLLNKAKDFIQANII